ncbi:MAG: hypothetical protein ACFFHD_03305, partial [Promethearchaeota archaeon]
VDLELNKENSIQLRNGVKAFNQKEKDNNSSLFEKFTPVDNNIKPQTLNMFDRRKDISSKQECKRDKKKMTLKEIYEEFWEFIDEKNNDFHEFIINDKRRKKIQNILV